MKKFLSVVACAASLAAGLSTTAAAEVDYKGYKLPFEVKAPLSVSLGWVEGDSDTTLQLAFSTDNELNQWLNYYAENTTHDAAVERLHKEYQIDELFVNAQVDWAIDDPVNGWHYTPYWDGEPWKKDDGTTQVAEFGMDKNYQYRIGSWDLVSEGVSDKVTVADSWILRGIWVYDPETTPDYTPEMNAVWLGTETTPGLKDQLKEDQYTLVPAGDEPGEYKLLIDYTQHTAYVRVRYGITVRDMKDNSQHIFSDWSEIASYGKDAKVFTPYTKESLAPPVITGLDYYPDEFNSYPQIACTLEVPEELAKNLTTIQANGGGISIEWEAKLLGTDDWVGLQGDWLIKSGQQVIALQNLAEHVWETKKEKGEDVGSDATALISKGTPVALRCRYYCSQYASLNGEYLGEFYTDYSTPLLFGTEEMSKPEETSIVEVSAAEVSKAEVSKTEVSKAETSNSAQPEVKKTNKWIWIILIIVLIVVVIIIVIIAILLGKKKKNNNDKGTPPAPPVDSPVNPIVNVNPEDKN